MGRGGGQGGGVKGGHGRRKGFVQYLRPYGVHSRSGRCNRLSCCPSSGLDASNSPISSGNRFAYLRKHTTSFLVHTELSDYFWFLS